MTVALIVAAGSGERLGAGRPKALVPLAGKPMLQWSIDALAGVGEIEQIVIALPPDLAGRGVLPEGVRASGPTVLVAGGAVRSESVRRALDAGAHSELVLVHDAARPLLTAAIAGVVLDALAAEPGAQAAIAAAPVSDTIKRTGADMLVSATLARSQLWSVQTPQVFRAHALRAALDVPAEQLAAATDDAQLIEQGGGRVLVVPTSPENLKVTTPTDLRLAELLLAARSAGTA
jgi:2-C-methyl-D-erythritol 4-phosphate cytidylyltransferase